MSVVSSTVKIDRLVIAKVSEYFLFIVKEFVEEEGICDDHGKDDHQKVEYLTESKVKVILDKAL